MLVSQVVALVKMKRLNHSSQVLLPSGTVAVLTEGWQNAQPARSSSRRVNLVRTLAIEGYEFLIVYTFCVELDRRFREASIFRKHMSTSDGSVQSASKQPRKFNQLSHESFSLNDERHPLPHVRLRNLQYYRSIFKYSTS